MMEYNYVSCDGIPLIMTVEDLMPILLIGRSTAYKLVRSGKLKTFRVEKQIRISRDALIEYIKQEQQRHDT